MKCLMGYMGGKVRLSPQIVNYIPDHKKYIEPFFGMGSVFFKKGRKKTTNMKDYHEIINDKDNDLTNFFMYLRDHGLAMQKILKKMEYSKFLHDLSKTTSNYYKKQNNFMKAVLFYYNIRSSFQGIKNAHSLSFDMKVNRPMVHKNKVKELNIFTERLRDAAILNRDVIDVINKFDSEDSFFYFDPPYKDTNKYEQDVNHQGFFNRIKTIKGKFILSHYYDDNIKDNFGDGYFIYPLKHYQSAGLNSESEHFKKTGECIVLNFNPEETPMWRDIPKENLIFT